MAPVDGASPFFVVGCPRSGTTLLSVLLDRHSRLCVQPETAYFLEIAPHLWYRTRRVGLRRLLHRWPRLAELGLDADDVLRALPRNGALEPALLRTLLGLYAERRGKVRAGEKTPLHLLRVGRLFRHFPDARVICVLRDGREAALSLAAMPWQRGTLADAAAIWRRSVRVMERWARTDPERFLVVRYEDLVSSPRRTLRQAIAFLGERFEDTQLSTAVPSGSVLPRSLEWKGEALGEIDRDAIGRRGRRASPGDLALLDRLLRDDLARCGYIVYSD
jgi:hypothetical protein